MWFKWGDEERGLEWGINLVKMRCGEGIVVVLVVIMVVVCDVVIVVGIDSRRANGGCGGGGGAHTVNSIGGGMV